MNENLKFKKFCKAKKRFGLADFFSCLLQKTCGFFSFVLGNSKLLIILFLIGILALALPFLNLPFLPFLNFKKYKIVEDKIQNADVAAWLQSNKVEITIYKTNEVFIEKYVTNVISREVSKEEVKTSKPKAVYIDEWKRYNPLD